MYVALSGLDLALGIFLLPAWLLAAVTTGLQPGRRTAGRMRRMSRIALVLVSLALLLTAARLLVYGLLARQGWVFAGDRRLFTTFLMLLPGVLATAVWTVPWLASAARVRLPDRDAPVPLQEQSRARSPRHVVPPRLAAFGGFGCFAQLFLPPDRSFWISLCTYGLLTAAAAALLVWRANARLQRMSTGREIPWQRALAVRLGWAVAVLAAVMGLVNHAIAGSRLPHTFSMMKGEADWGGGAAGQHHSMAGGHPMATGTGGAGEVSVDQLRGPTRGTPDRRFSLTAQAKKVKLASGTTVDAWTYNGQIPGPQLRVTEGDLVEIKLRNGLPGKTPVTLHWHGVDVPNREDGVAGATQDAVLPGQSFTYRFRVKESGTRWYHSHQAASEQVDRGLFGALIIEPKKQRRPVDKDVSVIAHDWQTDKGTVPAIGACDELEQRRAEPGEKVRMRLTNTSGATREFAVDGVPYKVTALDGTDVHKPTALKGKKLLLGGGNRMDVEFTMPDGPVRVTDGSAPDAGIVYSPNGTGKVKANLSGPEFDPYGYGSPKRTELGPDSDFDRTYRLVFDEWLGLYDGSFGLKQTINGRVFPDTPMLMIKEGDLARATFINRGSEDHPMHLHGHHMLVLSKNGKRASGSPMWQDTVLVRPGEEVQVAFKADNPGIWMDHCHNFFHSKLGMVMHLAYDNVTTPYEIGGPVGNKPE
ncbi:multicopper oxidase family protein [Streptomyces sp. NPDC051214]|uniref:multicopper oxidase family protein n=1 Tax=Streptomyces sp. NPDC051214 TaxID=3155282 RepID=UPI003434D248